MASRTQEELEQPAKMYQLQAVESKVDRALEKLDEIAKSVSGVVTTSQLDAKVRELKDEFDETVAVLDAKYGTALSEEVSKIHLKYGSTYKIIWSAIGAIILGLVAAVVAQFNNFWRGQ